MQVPDFEPDPAVPAEHLRRIGIEHARDRGLTGAGTLIGVLDTGIDALHAEFIDKNVYFQEFDANGHEVANQMPWDAAGGHGTAVCSLAAGATLGVAMRADLAVARVLTAETVSGGYSGEYAQIHSCPN